MRNAIGFFQNAIEVDPNYALAYAGLADTYNSLHYFGALPPRQVMPVARAAAAKGLEIDTKLAEVHAAMGFIKVYNWNWPDAERDFKRAIKLNPGYADAYYRYGLLHLTCVKRFDEAAEKLDHALRLDPLSVPINSSFGIHYYFVRNYDKAIERAQETLNIYPNYWIAHYILSWAYQQTDRLDEAAAALDKAQSFEESPLIEAARANLFIRRDEPDKARTILANLHEQSKQRYISIAHFARINAALGETSEALEQLETAFENQAADLIWIAVDPMLDPLRAEPQFIDLMRRTGY